MRIPITDDITLVTLEDGKVGLFHHHGFCELKAEDARLLTRALVTHFAKLRRAELDAMRGPRKA